MPHAKIFTHQAMHTLRQLHAELGGKILDNKKEAERLRQSMVHVEHVMRLLDPSFNVRPIAVRRRKPNPYFKRGTIWRAVLDALRAAPGPLTAGEVTAALLASKGVHGPARNVARDLEGAVRVALKKHENRGVCQVLGAHPSAWRIQK